MPAAGNAPARKLLLNSQAAIPAAAGRLQGGHSRYPAASTREATSPLAPPVQPAQTSSPARHSPQPAPPADTTQPQTPPRAQPTSPRRSQDRPRPRAAETPDI